MTDSWGRPEGAGRGGAGAPVFADGGERDAGASEPGTRVPRQAPGRSDGRRSDDRRGGSGRAQRRRGAVARREIPGAVPALVLVAVPLLGALAGAGSGPLFLVGALLGAIPAALLCTRGGVWWVATGVPPVVLLMSLFGHLLENGASAGSAALATHLVAWVAGAFPVMALATGGAALVGVGRVVRGRQAKGSSRG